MKYNLVKQSEANEAFTYLTELVGREAIAEIKKVSPKRSLSQNSYLHLLLGAFGQHFGYTLDEAKLIYKELNGSLYMYEKEVRGKVHKFLRSSADLTVEEMTRSIETLREWSDKGGYPLPTATDQAWLMEIENQIERSQKYL